MTLALAPLSARTSAGSRLRVPLPLARLAASLAVLLVAVGVRAQAPLTLVNDETTVSALTFEFEDTQTLLIEDLQLQIATKAPDPGIVAGLIRRIAGDPNVYPFDPIELARDVVRLRRYYEENGFPRADVDYEVDLDTASNTVDVTFLIDQGPPLLIDEVAFAGPGQVDVATLLAPEIRDEWAEYTRQIRLRSGQRLARSARLRLQTETTSWLRNRGYAFANSSAESFPDSTGLMADVRVKVNVGPRATFGRIRVLSADTTDAVRGVPGIADGVILRELPFESGDLFDASALAEGQQEIFSLGIFQLAVVDVDPGQARSDTTIDVTVRVRRGPTRVLNAFGGYFSDGGLTVRGQASHLNFFGAARRLSLGLEWRTGIGGVGGRSVSGGPIRDLRATLTFRQPYVLDRRLSYTFQPSVRDRDDEIEQSLQAEVANTLLFTQGQLRTAALSLTGRYRDLSRGQQGVRFLDGGFFELQPEPTIPSSLTATTGVLGADMTWGRLDDPLQPRAGYVLRPSLSAAGGDVSYARARLAATVLRPVGETLGLAARATVGTLVPLGGTSADQTVDYVLLRDQLFYAGGTTDVRGWAAARLGPKTLAVTPPVSATEISDPVAITSPGDVNYVGVGGRLKASASLQLNLPLPIGPKWGASVFLDGGQVWSPSTVPSQTLLRQTGAPADSTLADLVDGEGGLRFASGAGIQYLTPVGFISFGLGVKLNPSYFDLHQAARVYCGDSIYADDPTCFSGAVPSEGEALGYLDARLNGTDFDPDEIRSQPILGRIQLYISIGQTF